MGETEINSTGSISSDEKRGELERVLAGEDFSRSPRLSSFLRFIIEESLAGRGERINGTQVAIEVFDRDASFDPRTDPVVRAEAGRLRRALERYYLTAGARNPLRIEIPKGGYRPEIKQLREPASSSQVARPESHGNLSVAVLPLRNLSGDLARSFFAEALTEQIAIALSRFQYFWVTTARAAPPREEQAMEIRELGRGLGVRFVLDGSVSWQDDQIRLAATLSDTATGHLEWAEQFDCDLKASDLFKLQDDLTRKVAARVTDAFGLIPRIVERPAPESNEELSAQESLLRYLEYTKTRGRPQFFRAAEALEEVVAREPGYASGLAMLSLLCSYDYIRKFTPAEGPPERAYELANRAVELRPDQTLPNLACARAAFIRRIPEQVILASERAVQANPYDAAALGYAGYLIGFAGQWARGMEMLREAQQLNPNLPSWLRAVTVMGHYLQGHYELALADCRAFSLTHWLGGHVLRAAALGQLGRKDEAAVEVEAIRKLEPRFAADPGAFVRPSLIDDEQIEKLVEGLQKAGF